MGGETECKWPDGTSTDGSIITMPTTRRAKPRKPAKRRRACARAAKHVSPPQPAPDPVAIWTTKDGTEIPVTHLGDQHLANCIELLERKTPIAGLYAAQLLVPDLCGMTEVGAEAVLDELVSHRDDPAYYWPIYDDLLAERDRRAREGVKVEETAAPTK